MRESKQGGRGSCRWKRVVVAFEFLLVICGAASVSYCAYAAVQAHAARAQLLVSVPEGPPARPGSSQSSDVIGEIRIPKLGIAAPITTGIEKIELIRGVGHIPGTAFPGGLGTMGLAGHRDTFFRELRRITPGTIIQVMGSDGTYSYKTDRDEIVTPEQTEVLDIDTRPELVLVTCYPFTYIGAAPRRFIVHAHLISAAPAPNNPNH